jgi:bacteriophage N4 adsorption protein B
LQPRAHSNFVVHHVYTILFTLVALLLLINALDDLTPALLCAWHWALRRRLGRGDAADLSGLAVPFSSGERRIAIFVACWHESPVIANMVRHNLAAIRYGRFQMFLGAYPNDQPTVLEIRKLEQQYKNVHGALVPHDGPTSKADCLNWLYQALCDFEKQNGYRFDTVVVHDAEDMVHPDALKLIHTMGFEFDMVQVPVLPLPTPIHEFTHGIYCDEFAEYQSIDMPARVHSRSFVPSNGVGTGYAREVLFRLAEVRSNRVFDPGSLTEDYETGARIHQLGFTQVFARTKTGRSEVIATREYFPRKFGAALQQRTRWVTGICLQGWERLGWRGSAMDRYWFWRDRKALLTNPLGLLVNALLLAALLDGAWALTGAKWVFAVDNPLGIQLYRINLAIQCLRLGLRMLCVSRIFGLRFALAVPLRAYYGGVVNGIATLLAFRNWVVARWEKRPLAWVKTEHMYPSRTALSRNWKSLEEVLVGTGYLGAETLAAAHQGLPEGGELGAYLVSRGLISEVDLRDAANLTSGVSAAQCYVDPATVDKRTTRILPKRIQRECRVMAIGAHAGHLVLAAVQPPNEEMLARMQQYTTLKLEFRLLTVSNFAALEQRVAEVAEPRPIRPQVVPKPEEKLQPETAPEFQKAGNGGWTRHALSGGR